MPHLPAHVANAFLYRAKQDGISDVTPLKIQKLVYCLHGWHLATRNAPVVGELFEAWPYGPVLSSIYHEFKKNGKNSIQEYAREIDPMTGQYRPLMVAPDNKDFYALFDPVWQRYKNMSGIALSALTHAAGTPWTLARARGATYLSDDEIKSHFREIAAKG
jgi:uncharacterized phage-associated protein